MGLADKLNELTANSNTRNAYCSFGLILVSLAEEDRNALEKAIKSTGSTRSIYDALRSEGFRIERNVISLHRKGYCRCVEAK